MRPSSRDEVFLGTAAVDWVSTLVDAVLDGKRVVGQSGEPGAGKTVLLDVAAEQLRGRGIDVIRAARPLPGPLGFQRMIGNAAGVHRPEAMEPAMLVQAVAATGRAAPIVLMVDDAHTLTNASLRYLWLMSSLLGFGGVKLQLVLVGQLGLDGMLLSPEFAQLRFAAGALHMLPALDDDEAIAYLDHKLRAAGSSLRQVMSEPAMEELLRQSAGFPGEIDLLAGRALASKPQLGLRRISRRTMAAASDDAAARKHRRAAKPVRVLAGAAGGLAVAALMASLFLPHQPALMAPALLQPQAATDGTQARRTPDPAALAAAPKEAGAMPPTPETVTETTGVTPAPLQAAPPKLTPPEAEPFPIRTVETGNTQLREFHNAQAQAVSMMPLAEARPPSFGGGLPSAGKGLVLLAKAGDSVPSLYRQVYRGVTPPPYEEVAAANPPVLRPGDLLVFPAPPNGWRN